MVARRLSPGQVPRCAAAGDWVTFCASATPAELREMDAIVERIKAAGITKISRSRLIRIGIARLDVDALVAELLRLR